jgi:hypothetical protein
MCPMWPRSSRSLNTSTDLPPEFCRQIEGLLGAAAFYRDPGDTWAYGYDNSKRHACPAAVALPADETQLQEAGAPAPPGRWCRWRPRWCCPANA